MDVVDVAPGSPDLPHSVPPSAFAKDDGRRQRSHQEGDSLYATVLGYSQFDDVLEASGDLLAYTA